ncbi:probable G-protein coupled receptor 156 isoform X2 [Amia ocellicauda]|uniref:probable G-protein coupled receptor 156 isoform X2 n=1 Tax=Amia ocellicauda TaxID=2972642 RepID=UPI003464BFDA
MEAALNCSDICDSRDCTLDPDIDTEEGWKVLHKLCRLLSSSVSESTISPVLCAVMWTLLSCGILLAAFFLVFTIRFKSNRIVKMSSPNLNVLTLCGSVLTYSSGVLFGIEERALLSGNTRKTLLQARVWTLCIGSSLVFGPILGKTWRLYKVFTQRVPDKRVIIKDIQLMGLVAGLILLDILVLITWGFADPVQCIRSVGALVKIFERGVFYSVSQLESCASLYTDVWIVLISVLKGSLLLYGTYLAGLTSNVSSPPVNQSLTIMAAVFLITVSAAVAFPVTRLLYSWPNLVYSFISGGIFICTLTINCLVFVPQLMQWKQFEDELNQTQAQMAKYFSSPSKSIRSMYSEDEIYYLLGENSSMKQLLTEKNAVIDSLQEQVNSAKDKLMRLMSAHSNSEDDEFNSAVILNSASTQVTEVKLEASWQGLDCMQVIMQPPPSTDTACIPGSVSHSQKELEFSSDSVKNTKQPLNNDSAREKQNSNTGGAEDMQEQPQAVSLPNNITETESRPSCDLSPALLVQSSTTLAENSGSLKDESLANKHNYVSSEKLQEILQDLSIDAVSSLRSPNRVRKAPVSAKAQIQYYYSSISPYIMRKRRPPFNSARGGPPRYCFPGSVPLCPGPAMSGDLIGTCGSNDATPELGSNTLPVQNPNSNVVNHSLITVSDEGEPSSHDSKTLPPRCAKHKTRHGNCDLHIGSAQARRCSITPFSEFHSPHFPSEKENSHADQERYPYDYSDTDSSSSDENYCYYHRPYCSTCLQRPYDSTESTSSETSDSEFAALPNRWRRPHSKNHPVVNFKEDLKPTFV